MRQQVAAFLDCQHIDVTVFDIVSLSIRCRIGGKVSLLLFAAPLEELVQVASVVVPGLATGLCNAVSRPEAT